MKSILIFALLLFFGLYVEAKLMVINGLTHIHKSDVGLLVNGKIQLKNVGKTEERVVIYKNDLFSDCANAANFAEPNTHPRSMASWLTTNVDERLLQPGEEYELVYSIKVPSDSSLHGSYWSVLMIEGNEPISEQKKSGVMISSKARYAIQIITDVGAESFPTLTFDKIDFTSVSDSVKVIKVKIKNEGGILVKTKVMLDLVNADGEKINTVESAFRRIYPNTCVEYELVLKNVHKGRYEGLLMADYGQDLFATNLDVDIK